MLNNNLLLKNSSRIFNCQWVRWKSRPKKPFWLGIAKSKRFVIKEDPVLPEPENTELSRLQTNYDISMASLLNYINSDEFSLVTSKVDANQSTSDEQMQNWMEESIRKNELWNNQCAELRNKRLQMLALSNSIEYTEKLKNLSDEKIKLMSKVEKIVKEEKIKSQSYITEDNLDEAIDKCLNQVVDYNFAIDLNGNMIKGKDVYQKTS